MKVLTRLLSMTLLMALLVGFLLFGNLSVYYGNGVQQALKLHLALQFNFPRLPEKAEAASWQDYLLSSLSQSFLYAFAQPATPSQAGLTERALTPASVWARLQALVRIVPQYQNEISSHNGALPGSDFEKNIDMNTSIKEKTN